MREMLPDIGSTSVHPAHAEAIALAEQSARLTGALRALIDSSPLTGLGPIELARALGVDKTLASRLLAALRETDSLASLSILPGAAALRQFIRAVRDNGAAPGAVGTAESELRAFDQALQRTYGTRTRLDAALADALPETRRKHQETARQCVFRGMSLIKGVSIDVASLTWIVHPSREQPDRVDTLVIAGFVGIRRLRPTARVRLAGSHRGARPEGGAKLLTEFCRPAGLSINESREGTLTFYEISTGPIRRDADADVYLTEALPAGAPLAGPASAGHAYGEAVGDPYKRLVLNVLIHGDVWRGCDFSLCAYDTATRGMLSFPDPEREADRLWIDAAIKRSPVSPLELRSIPVPGYADVVTRASASLNWGLDGFRMFSCDVAYPIYGSQVFMLYEPSV